MLGMAGTNLTPFDSLLRRLDVSPSAAVDLARDLLGHAVTSASHILTLRHCLDHPKANTPDNGQALCPPDLP